MLSSTTVLIVGAGPTGLTMAVMLQRYGIPFRIIDEKVKPVSTSNALAVHIRTLEIWDDLGLLEDALALGSKIHSANIYAGNKKLATLDFDAIKTHYPFVLSLAQHDTEKIMLDYLKKRNITVEMGVELKGFEHNAKEVIATLKHKNGDTEILHADWLIACDGGHSLIRNILDIPFIGKELDQHFVLADIESHSLSEHDVNGFLSENGLLLSIPYNKKYLRVIAEVSEDAELRTAESLSAEQIQQLIINRSNLKLNFAEAKYLWSSRFWIHQRIIPNYRYDKVFFVGDSAHLHSPAGGQGMNTGIQDAYNLGWKLALVIQNKAKPNVLGTYQTERYDIALRVLRDTTVLTKIISIHNSFLIRIRNFLISLVMKSAKVRHKAVNKMSLLAIQYHDTLLVKDCLPSQPGPLAGTRMLDAKYKHQRLFDLVRGGNFVLLMFSGSSGCLNVDNFLQFQTTIKEKYQDLVRCILINTKNGFENWDAPSIFDVNKTIHQEYSVTKNPCLYLIRPDKYIGFRGGLEHQDQLQQYLAVIL